jgi:hypothetical protein
VTVEIMEQAETEERRMSKATVGELQAEFETLLNHPTQESARALLPSGAIIRGEPSISLAGGYERYTAVIRCNPGEPGNLYLKAYEITGEVPLSESRLKKARPNSLAGRTSQMSCFAQVSTLLSTRAIGISTTELALRFGSIQNRVAVIASSWSQIGKSPAGQDEASQSHTFSSLQFMGNCL